ncbi:MAG: hypothetical protein WBV69_22300 [Candidatus Sulfotelmatobacter sp.]
MNSGDGTTSLDDGPGHGGYSTTPPVSPAACSESQVWVQVQPR